MPETSEIDWSQWRRWRWLLTCLLFLVVLPVAVADAELV